VSSHVAREVGILLRPKLLAVRRRRGSRGRLGRVLVLLAVGAAAWPFIYLTLVRLLTALRGVEEIGPLLAARLLGLALLLFLGILLLSNLIASLSSFFLARDLPALRSSPVDWLSVYTARLFETVVSSSWMVVLVLVPTVAAYARVYSGGPGFAVIVLVSLVPFLLIPAAVGSGLTLLLVQVFPARRSRDILAVTGVAAAALLVLVLRTLRPERLVNPETYRNLVDFLAVLRGPASPWLPSGWGADAMMGSLLGSLDPFHLVLLWSTAAATFVMGAALHYRLYPRCFTKAQEGNENRMRRHIGWRWLEALLRPLGVQRRELVLKDVRMFFRDTTQWSQLIILAVLVVVYVYNMQVLPLASGTGISRYLVTLVLFLNLVLTGFVLAAIAARFVFPMPSLEGRTLWLLLSAPVDAGALLGAKLLIGIVPMTVMALALTLATGLILGVPAGLFGLNLLAIVGLGAAFTAQALAWGVLYPQFESENAAQIPTSLGGLLFMLGALATLGLVTLSQIWPLREFLLSGLPGRQSRPPLPEELALAAGLTALVCVAGSVIPYRVAVRRWGSIGRWATDA
jgi:ABC-2 type transport system permease protein